MAAFVRSGGCAYQSGINDFWPVENWRSRPGEGLVAELGAGRIHHNPAFVEKDLWQWDPWPADQTNRWYALMRLPAPDVSSKCVELSIKVKENRRLFLLVNHRGEAEKVELRLGNGRLARSRNRAGLSSGRDPEVFLGRFGGVGL